MDLAIPGEQYFYLKARTAAERQQWLVALGSAKACITDIRTKKEKGKMVSSCIMGKMILMIDIIAAAEV